MNVFFYRISQICYVYWAMYLKAFPNSSSYISYLFWIDSYLYINYQNECFLQFEWNLVRIQNSQIVELFLMHFGMLCMSLNRTHILTQKSMLIFNLLLFSFSFVNLYQYTNALLRLCGRICLKKLGQKEKLLTINNFSLCHNVYLHLNNCHSLLRCF